MCDNEKDRLIYNNVPSIHDPEDDSELAEEEDGGIVSFLSDAIGQDVETEMLREFSGSDAFAELMDVVTSSFSQPQTSTTTNLIKSLEESTNPVEDSKISLSNETRVSESQKPQCRRIRQKVVKQKRQGLEKKKIYSDSESDSNSKPEITEQASKCKQIQNRLRIRLKFGSAGVIDSTPNLVEKVKPNNKPRKSLQIKSKQTKSNKYKLRLIDDTNQKLNKSTQEQAIVDLNKIKPCYVIVFKDILKMRKFCTPSTSFSKTTCGKNTVTFISTEIQTQKLEMFENNKRKKLLQLASNKCKYVKNQSLKVDKEDNQNFNENLKEEEETKQADEINDKSNIIPEVLEEQNHKEINKITKGGDLMGRVFENKNVEKTKGIEIECKLPKEYVEKVPYQAHCIEIDSNYKNDVNVENKPVKQSIVPEEKENVVSIENPITVDIGIGESLSPEGIELVESFEKKKLTTVEKKIDKLPSTTEGHIECPTIDSSNIPKSNDRFDRKKQEETKQESKRDDRDYKHGHRKKSTERSSRKENDKHESQSQKHKSLKFERSKHRDDSGDKKFDELKHERKRKSSETKADRHKEKEVRKIELKKDIEHKTSGKTFTNSFRIPKKHGTNEPSTSKHKKEEYASAGGNECTGASASRLQFLDSNKSSRLSRDKANPKKASPKKDLKQSRRFISSESDSSINVIDKTINLPQFDKEHVKQTENSNPDEDNPSESSLFGEHSISRDSTMPPVSHVEAGEFTVAVSELLRIKTKQTDNKHTFENYASSKDDTLEEIATEKCAWWFAQSDKEPPLNEFHIMLPLESYPSSYGSEAGSDISFAGNVSNPELRDDNDCQVNEISSTSQAQIGIRQDVKQTTAGEVDEYFGRSLLQAKIRTSSGKGFQNIFELRSGALYEKENFQAKCNLCNQLIIGRRDLAKHLKGKSHKDKFRSIGIGMESTATTSEPVVKNEKSKPIESKEKVEEKKTIKTEPKEKESSSPAKKSDNGMKVKDDSTEKPVLKIKREKESKEIVEMEIGRTSSGLQIKVPVTASSRKQKTSRSPIELVRRSSSKSKRRSRTRSRSRDRRRRSRSPRRRTRSPIRRIPRTPEKCRNRSKSPRASRKRSKSPSRRHYSSKRNKKSGSRSPQLAIKKNNKEFNEKLALTAEGKWTEEMENQWKLMEAEEAMFLETFHEKRKSFISTPEEHPKYAKEWEQFWERRYQEVEKEGKDPDKYEYVNEWKEFWSKRLKVLLQEDADNAIQNIKIKYKMDFDSLNRLKKTVRYSVGQPESSIPQLAVPINGSNFTIELSTLPSTSSTRANIVRSVGPVVPSLNAGGGDAKRVDVKPVSVEDFKSTWEALTRPKVNKDLGGGSMHTEGLKLTHTPISTGRRNSECQSEMTTSSEASYDFDGFDLVQVLRLMCKCEDQLSFLATKVLEYFNLAEELELKSNRGSYSLLNNEELVTVLFQSRDRFMTIIRSNVLSRDILKNINLAVYGLNSILDAPQCQRFRPKLPAAFTADPDISNSGSVAQTQVRVQDPNGKESNSNPNRIEVVDDKQSLFNNISSEKKLKIAAEVTKYLILIGRDHLNDSKLSAFLSELLVPLLQKSETLHCNTSSALKDHINQPKEEKPVLQHQQQSSMKFEQNRPETVLRLDNAHSFDMRISGVSSSKVVGSALPSLPMPHRTSEIMPSLTPVAEPSTSRENKYLDTNSSKREGDTKIYDRKRRDANNDRDGRSSPFSRREFSGNLSRL